MKNTLKKMLCLLLVFLFIFSMVACGGGKNDDDDDDDEDEESSSTSDKDSSSKDDEESSSKPSSSSKDDESSSGSAKYSEVIIIFDYSDYDGVVWDDDFDEELVVDAGSRIGSMPKPKLNGYLFDGWYNEDGERIRTTYKVDGSVEEIVLYAQFSEDPNAGATEDGFNCPKGFHNWKTIREDPTCDKAGSSTRVCQICNIDEIDAMYAVQNPALGHQWVEDGAIDDGGWTYIALARQRTCKREGCDKKETKQLENLTSLATVTASIDAGAWPGTAEWPGILTDNVWEGKPNAAPKGGGPLTVTLLLSKATEIDQIAMAVQGFGEDGYSSKFSIYLWYADEADFGESAVANGAFLSTSGNREGAICIDRSQDDRPILGIKIVQEKTLHGSEYWEEIAIGKIPDEE